MGNCGSCQDFEDTNRNTVVVVPQQMNLYDFRNTNRNTNPAPSSALTALNRNTETEGIEWGGISSEGGRLSVWGGEISTGGGGASSWGMEVSPDGGEVSGWGVEVSPDGNEVALWGGVISSDDGGRGRNSSDDSDDECVIS